MSIAPFYAPVEELPVALLEDDGRSTSERIAIDAIKLSDGFETGEKNDAESPPEMQLDVLGTIDIMNQSF